MTAFSNNSIAGSKSRISAVAEQAATDVSQTLTAVDPEAVTAVTTGKYPNEKPKCGLASDVRIVILARLLQGISDDGNGSVARFFWNTNQGKKMPAKREEAKKIVEPANAKKKLVKQSKAVTKTAPVKKTTKASMQK